MRAMKDSGIAWIGEIPSEWDIERMKNCVTMRDAGAWGMEQQNNANDVICLRVADLDYARLRFTESNHLTIRNYDNLQIKKLQLHKGDILVEKSGGGDKTPVGRAVIFDKEYKALFANFMERIRVSQRANSKYFLYVLNSFYENRYVMNYIKQTTGIQNLDITSLFSLEKIPFPPLTEQTAITSYLDDKCSKIDAIITKNEQIIEKLKSYKSSLITEKVTKGLNPDVEMKDSGVEWIGKIPAEWGYGRIKYNYYLKGRIGWQGLKASEFIDDGPYLVTGTDFINGGINWESCYHISEERYNEAPEIHVKLGDLLITKDGTVGKVAFISYKPDKVSLNSHLLIMRPTNNQYSNKFLFWIIQSNVFERYFQLSQNGSIMASLSQEKINNFSFALPSFSEQTAIASYLDDKCSKIDANIKNRELIIQKLTDYKKSLIYEVITGKKEVVS